MHKQKNLTYLTNSDTIKNIVVLQGSQKLFGFGQADT